MDDSPASKSSTQSLSRLMVLKREEAIWPDSDLADLLRHQLIAPVIADMAQCDAIGGATLCEIQDLQTNLEPFTFGGVLFGTAPPLLLLQAIKKFGKLASQQNVGLPSEIALTLYYLAILAALLRHDQRISGKDDASLRKIAKQIDAQPWVDDATRALCHEAIAKLKGL